MTQSSKPSNSSGAIISLQKGDHLFTEGDEGGDLYFIQSGSIEIYKSIESEAVPLTTMKAGEVIGTLTCMTKSPRLASAKALEDCVIKKVEHDNISKLINGLPKWMTIVLNDFRLRLEYMNKKYSQVQRSLKASQANQVSPVFISAQLAACISNSCSLKKVLIDDEIEGLFPSQILDFLEPMLLQPRKLLEEIFEVFVSSGLIVLKIEQDKKRKYFTLDNALRLKSYPSFVESSVRGPTRKLIQAKFSGKENRTLTALLELIKYQKLPSGGELTLTSKSLKNDLKAQIGQDFELENLETAIKLGLIKKTGPENDESIVFVPSQLSLSLSHKAAFHKLQKIEI